VHQTTKVLVSNIAKIREKVSPVPMSILNTISVADRPTCANRPTQKVSPSQVKFNTTLWSIDQIAQEITVNYNEDCPSNEKQYNKHKKNHNKSRSQQCIVLIHRPNMQ